MEDKKEDEPLPSGAEARRTSPRSVSRNTVALVMVAFFTAVTLLFFYKLLAPEQLVYQGDLTSSDITELNFPRRDLLGRSLKSGELPIWTNLIGDGFPLLAEGQTGIFYPPNLVLFGLLDPVTGYNLSVILSFILGMAFTYLLARALRLGRYASAFAAVAFGMSGFFIARIRFMALINGCSWLPLAVYGVEKLHQTRKLRYAAVSGVALAMQVFAGFVQIFYITALTVILYFLYRFLPDIWRAWRSRRGEAREKEGEGTGPAPAAGWRRSPAVKATAFALACILLVFVLAAALSAVQLIPTQEGIKASNRAGGVTFEEATIFPMTPKNLVMFVSPFQFGNPALGTFHPETYGLFWESCAYSGVITLVLAVLALVVALAKKTERRADAFFWVVVLGLALLVSLGSSTPFYKLLWYVVPGMRLFRFPQRFLLVAVLALALLGAMGLEFLASRKGRLWRLAVPVAIVILVAELFAFSFTQVNTLDSRVLLTEPETVHFLCDQHGRYRVGHIGELESWKLAVYDVAKGWHRTLEPYLEYQAMLEPESNMLFDVEAVASQGQYGVNRVKQLLAWTQSADFKVDFTAYVPDSSLRILGAQNVRFVFSQFLIQNRYLQPVARFKFPGIRDIIVYQNLFEQPRAYVAGDYTVVKDAENTSLDVLFGESFNPSEKVMLEESPSARFKRGGTGKAYIATYKQREVSITTVTSGGGLLVLADTFYPGWKASVDGQEAKVLRANYAFRAVEVPDGRHTVKFTYTPGHYYLGMAISLVTALAILSSGLMLFYRRRWWNRNRGQVSGPLS